MELMAWGFEEEVGDVLFDYGGRRYKVKDVKALQAMGAMITQDADSMSAMRLRMRKADEALWRDLTFYKKQRNCRWEEAQKVQRSCAIVHSSLK